jgi:hypothetical protein
MTVRQARIDVIAKCDSYHPDYVLEVVPLSDLLG